MKITKYFLLAIMAVMFVSAYTMSAADVKKSKYPKEVFGLGTRMTSGDDSYGVIGTYALDEKSHVGLEFGFSFDKGLEEGADSHFFMHFAPYYRMLLTANKTFKPFIEAGFIISSKPNKTYNQIANVEQVRTTDSESFRVSVGAMWFPYKSVAVHGGFQLLKVDFSPAVFYGGLMNTFVGIEWYVF